MLFRSVEREGAILVLKPGSRIAPEAGPQVAGQGVGRDLPLFDRLPKKVQEGIGGRGPVVIGELSVLEIILQRAGGGGRREVGTASCEGWRVEVGTPTDGSGWRRGVGSAAVRPSPDAGGREGVGVVRSSVNTSFWTTRLVVCRAARSFSSSRIRMYSAGSVVAERGSENSCGMARGSAVWGVWGADGRAAGSACAPAARSMIVVMSAAVNRGRSWASKNCGSLRICSTERRRVPSIRRSACKRKTSAAMAAN